MFTDFMFVSLPDKEKVREIQHRESEVGRKDHLRRESHSGRADRAKSFLSHMAHDVVHLAEEIAHHETKVRSRPDYTLCPSCAIFSVFGGLRSCD